MNTDSVLGDPTGVFAVLRLGKERWMGRLLARTDGSPAQVGFPEDATIDRLPLGTFLVAGLAAHSMARPAQCRARLLALTHYEGVLAAEIELDDPAIWTEVLPKPLQPSRDRRRWPRLAPNAASEQRIHLQIDVGPHSGRSLSGFVMDRSEGGLAVRLPMQAEERLCRADRVLCWVPGERGPRRASVRHRALLPLGVRYGLRFEGEPLTSPRTYEPLWTCPSCTTSPLLGRTHEHCPACGVARGTAPLTFPDWDDLLATEEHPFFGGDRCCLRCGSAFSRQARNCGHCGTRLPQA